ncbi:MAG: elongation factor 1-beta [Desulfurococcales archaeon]|nr:elongation factor 1-beta [Desulfurococcales archaeon]
MARVAVFVKVFPESPEIKTEELIERIKSSLADPYKLENYGEEPIAFGYKALKVVVSMPEETEGGTEQLEEILKNVDGIQEVEVELVQRMG